MADPASLLPPEGPEIGGTSTGPSPTPPTNARWPSS